LSSLGPFNHNHDAAARQEHPTRSNRHSDDDPSYIEASLGIICTIKSSICSARGDPSGALQCQEAA
jgi:hypothetical protein